MRIPNKDARAKIGKKILYEVTRTTNAERLHEGDNIRSYSYFYTDLYSALMKYDEMCMKYPGPKSRHITLKRWNTSGPMVTDIFCNRRLGAAGEYRDVSKRCQNPIKPLTVFILGYGFIHHV